MQVETMQFGAVVYEKTDLIRFEEGLFGFENQKDFLPIPLEEDNDAVLFLQSVKDQNLSFIIMNPFLLDHSYEPVLQREDYVRLESSNDEDLSYYVICVMRERPEESTVNLKCPIIVNARTRKAIQTILTTGAYQLRHHLSDFSGKEAPHAGVAEKKG